MNSPADGVNVTETGFVWRGGESHQSGVLGCPVVREIGRDAKSGEARLLGASLDNQRKLRAGFPDVKCWDLIL